MGSTRSPRAVRGTDRHASRPPPAWRYEHPVGRCRGHCGGQDRPATARPGPGLEGGARAEHVQQGERAHQPAVHRDRPVLREPLEGRRQQRWRHRARCHQGRGEGRRLHPHRRAARRAAGAGGSGPINQVTGTARGLAGQLQGLRHRLPVRDQDLRELPDVGPSPGLRVRRGHGDRRGGAACRRVGRDREEAVHRDRRLRPGPGRTHLRVGDRQGPHHRQRGRGDVADRDRRAEAGAVPLGDPERQHRVALPGLELPRHDLRAEGSVRR